MSQYYSLPVVSTGKQGIEMQEMNPELNDHNWSLEATNVINFHALASFPCALPDDHIQNWENDELHHLADQPARPATSGYISGYGDRPITSGTQMTFASDAASFLSDSIAQHDRVTLPYTSDFAISGNADVGNIYCEYPTAVVGEGKQLQGQTHDLQFCQPPFETNPESSFRDLGFGAGMIDGTRGFNGSDANTTCNVTDASIANMESACEQFGLLVPGDQGQVYQNDGSMDMGGTLEPAHNPSFTLTYPTTPDAFDPFCSVAQMQAQEPNTGLESTNPDMSIYEQSLGLMQGYARLTPDSVLDPSLSMPPDFSQPEYGFSGDMLDAPSAFPQLPEQEFTQSSDYDFTSARPSGSREYRSFSLPSAPYEYARTTSSARPDFSQFEALASELPPQSPLWRCSVSVQPNASIQSATTGITMASTAASVEPRSRPATAIGLGTGHSISPSLDTEEAKQEQREKHHQQTRARKESKLKNRMMRRASEQVAQAANLRIAPKSKMALGDNAQGGGDVSRPTSQGQQVEASGEDSNQQPTKVVENSSTQPMVNDASTPRILTCDTPSGPRKYAAISRAARTVCPSTRPKRPCPYANCSNVNGFSGDHELRRHIIREHSNRRPVWVLVDISPDKSVLSNCKKCLSGKRYNAVYNAAEHLRRHLVKKDKLQKTQKAQAKLPLKTLQPWMRMYEEINIGDGRPILVEVHAKNKGHDEHKHEPGEHHKQETETLKIEDDEMLPNTGCDAMAKSDIRRFAPSPSPSPPLSVASSYHSAPSPQD